MRFNFLPIQQRSFVPTEALAQAVAFDNGMMHVSLTDSRVISTSVVWFPRLSAATPSQLERCQIGVGGRGWLQGTSWTKKGASLV